MDSAAPAPWSYAARAAYWGDRVCAFCDHHNPAAAKFCNDCGSPLHLKPCNQCAAVNHQAATNCSKCGAEWPPKFTAPEATPVLPSAEPAPVGATSSGVDVAATVTLPRFAASPLRAGWRLLEPGQFLLAATFLLAAIATILIAGAYATYRIEAATPDAIGVASQPLRAGEENALTAESAVLIAVEAKPVEPEATAALQAPTNPEAPKRASARQRPVPKPHAPVGATLPVTKTLAAARVGAPVAETRKAQRPDPWQAMRVSLAQCGGDLVARIVCDQGVRRHFCEGHWGEAPECASGIANDRGQ